MSALEIIGTAAGLGFASGLRLYATVLALGLAVRFGLLAPPPGLAGLQALAHPAVLATAAVLCLVEFIGDKIPWVDSLWDMLHTAIRPLGAVVLAGVAMDGLAPHWRLALALAAGGVALSSHAAKAATRVAANQIPEPFSNIGLSMLGDVAAPALVWITLAHPVFMLCLVLAFLAVLAVLGRMVLRWLKSGFRRVRNRFGGTPA